MKQVFLLDRKEYDVHSSTIVDNKVVRVHYVDEKGNLIALTDSSYKYGDYEMTVENLHSKVIDKDEFKTKIVQDIKGFLADEEKILTLKDGEVAEANRGLYSNSINWKKFMDRSLVRQEQFGRVYGITDTLSLIKLALGN